jgi:hypothetical protein
MPLPILPGTPTGPGKRFLSLIHRNWGPFENKSLKQGDKEVIGE